MKLKKQISSLLYLVIAIYVCMILQCYPSVVCADEPPSTVVEAATKGLPFFLKAIPSGLIDQYGFADKREYEVAQLGKPYHLNTILPEAILNASSSSNIEYIISPTTQWYFPVVVNGEPRVVLKVDFIEGEWKAFGIGMSPLARDLASTNLEYPPSQGFEMTLVVIYQAGPIYCMLIKRGDECYFLPLGKGRSWLGLENISKANAGMKAVQENIVTRLQYLVRNNLNVYNKN